MSKILANQIANYGDNSPVEVKEGVNIPAGKPLQIDGSSGSSGQILSSTGTSIEWIDNFSGSYNDLTNKPTIPAAQVQSDWNAVGTLGEILNKPIVPPQPSVSIATASGNGYLTYNQSNGNFTFTPPNLSPYALTTSLANSNDWDTAYSWGDHSLAGYATTVSLNSAVANSGNWDTAYSWGDHSVAGYLTSFTETDPVFGASVAASITNSLVTNWNTAYSWGDHSTQGYITGLDIEDLGNVDISGGLSDQQVLKWDSSSSSWKPSNDLVGGAQGVSLDDLSVSTNPAGSPALSYNNTSGVFTYTPPDLSGYLTSFTETDPVFSASVAAGIIQQNVNNWNTSYSWGDHNSAGYIKFETDPIFAASDAAGISSTDIGNWNTAHGWGDHSTAGYLKPEPDGSTNLDAPLTITRASDTITTSNAFTSAHIVSQESIDLRLAAGADEFTDMAHVCGGFLSNGNFVQILHTYGGSGYRTHLVEMNPTTGQRVTFKYIWSSDTNNLFNTSKNDGYLTCQTQETFQDLRLDLNGNIVSSFRRSAGTWIGSINPSTWTISNVYQLNQSNYAYRTTVGKDGYTYFKGASNAIYKIDMSTGTVLSKLDSIASYTWFDVDSSGNIYTANNTNISKYTWTGATYTVAWSKTIAGISTYFYNGELTDSAIIISSGGIIASFSTADGSINWTRDLSPSNFTLPEVDAEKYDDWTATSNTYASSITVDSSNVYVKYYVDDGFIPENYEDSRYCLIVLLDISTGNCVDSLLLKKTRAGGYGEWYSNQHGIYWNNNKLIVPNISGIDPSTGNNYSNFIDIGYTYSTAYSYVENAHLDTSNISSNVGVAGPYYHNEIINTGSTVYTTTTNAAVTVVDNTVTPVVTISPTDLTLTSDIGLIIYDESDATMTEYLMDNKISNYLNPSVPDTLSITSPSDKYTKIAEQNVFREVTISENVKTQQLRIGHEQLDAFAVTFRADRGELQGLTDYDQLYTNFSNFRVGGQKNIVIGFCPNDDSNPSLDYYDYNTGGVQIGYQTRLTNNYSIAIGYQSGPNTTYTDGGNNVFLGQYTGGRSANANVGSGIVNIGAHAGSKSTGNNNISIGDRAAGHVNHTGKNQITIGNISQVNPTVDTGLAIGCYTGNWWQYTLGSESYWLTGDSSFNVNIPQQLTAGSLVAGGLTYPTTNGSNGDVLTSDGAGNVTWAAPAGGGGANVTISDTAPGGAQSGDLWWESDKGRLKIYYNDTDSTQWVDASPPLAQPNVPVAAGFITLNGTSPTWTGTTGYTVSGAQPGGAGTDYEITLTFPTAYSARTDYIVQATYDGTNYIGANGAEIGVSRGTSSVVFTPRRLDSNPLSLGEIMVTITNL